MKYLFCILIIPFILKPNNAQAQEDKHVPGYWMYCDQNIFIYLTLDADAFFKMHEQTATSTKDKTGTYTVLNDTLYLKGTKKTEKFPFSSLQIMVVADEHKDTYSNIYPLTPTQKPTVKDAYKECGIIRLQQRKRVQ